MNGSDVHTHLLHNLYSVAEREHNTLLCSTHDMSIRVRVEVQSVNAATCLTILQNTFRSVAKWDDAYSLATDRNLFYHSIHVGIRDSLRCNIAANPCIKDSCAVDAKQHSQTVLLLCIVYMCKSIHPRLRVVVHITQHSIHHPAGTCRCSYLTGIKHIERKRVVWLVATTISNRSASLQSQFISCLLRHFRLYTERRYYIGQQVIIETIIVKKKTSRTLLFEVPHHALTKSANSRIYSSTQTHSDIVARQHNLIYTFENLRFVLLHPRQFCSSEITRRIKQMTQTQFFAKTL